MKSRSGSFGNGKYWTLTILALLVLLLSISAVALSVVNRSAQAEWNVRQQYINQSIKLGQLNSQLVQELANVSAQTGDQQIRNILSSHGISFTTN